MDNEKCGMCDVFFNKKIEELYYKIDKIVICEDCFDDYILRKECVDWDYSDKNTCKHCLLNCKICKKKIPYVGHYVFKGNLVVCEDCNRKNIIETF